MYYEYWNLSKAPFDNVPDPTMYTECHSSMENALAETLFAIEEGEDCFAVIVGDVGLGKTLSIRMVIDSLDQNKYKIALITNPSLTFVQLMREIIGQLTGIQCEEKKKVDLLEIFNKLLFSSYDEGKKVIILIDEANVITHVNLENLRLLTNMQNDDNNLFTMVLAGQIELAKRLEHPKLRNLFQRIGTYCKIEKIQSEDLVKNYVETRLKLAGCTRKIFDDNAYSMIWTHSDYGVPRLINKICKLALKAGQTNELQFITGDIVNQVGQRFQTLSASAIPTRMPRKLPKNKIIRDITPETKKIELLKPENVLTNQDLVNENSFHNEDDLSIELKIGEYLIKTDLPANFIEQTRLSDNEERIKLAGAMAATIIKNNPKLTSSYFDDPVSVWGDIRELILNKIGCELIAV